MCPRDGLAPRRRRAPPPPLLRLLAALGVLLATASARPAPRGGGGGARRLAAHEAAQAAAADAGGSGEAAVDAYGAAFADSYGLNWRGAWRAGEAYEAMDLVQFSGGNGNGTSAAAADDANSTAVFVFGVPDAILPLLYISRGPSGASPDPPPASPDWLRAADFVLADPAHAEEVAGAPPPPGDAYRIRPATGLCGGTPACGVALLLTSMAVITCLALLMANWGTCRALRARRAAQRGFEDAQARRLEALARGGGEFGGGGGGGGDAGLDAGEPLTPEQLAGLKIRKAADGDGGGAAVPAPGAPAAAAAGDSAAPAACAPPLARDCPICLLTDVDASRWAVFPCGHGVCVPCLGDLARHTEARRAPAQRAAARARAGGAVLVRCALCRHVAAAGPEMLPRAAAAAPAGPPPPRRAEPPPAEPRIFLIPRVAIRF